LLKEKGLNIELTRVSPTRPTTKDLDRSIVDRFYKGFSEKEMANLYRNSDIFIASSLEVEGFGLPEIEALASGVPSILTEISSYKNFHQENNFAYFVPTNKPDKIAEGILTPIEDQRLREDCINKGLMVARNFTLETTKTHLFTFIKELD
jgi:alpha-1,3-rhamnosyl/mannosyltransferase